MIFMVFTPHWNTDGSLLEQIAYCLYIIIRHNDILFVSAYYYSLNCLIRIYKFGHL